MLRDTLSGEVLGRQGFLEPASVAKMIDDHVSGKEDLSRQLWGVLSFTLWHERYARSEAAVAG